MGGKRKRKAEIDDQSKWSHRFEFRDRLRVQREIFTPQLPLKRGRQDSHQVLSDSSQSEYSDRNTNAYQFELQAAESVPFQLPRAKTQVNRKHSTLKKAEDAKVVVKKVVEELLEAVQLGRQNFSKLKSSLYFNCDLRFFDLEIIVEKYGHFDVVCIDPPWRIQEKNGFYKFSNNKFSLDYETLSNQEIMDIPLEKLSKKGFCFLWVLSANMTAGYQCLGKWGYECIDHLMWIKTAQAGKSVMVYNGDYFLHSTETCLVGYKCPQGQRVEFRSKVSNDIIISDVRRQTQKPDQLYTIIDLMMPGSKKVEVFARNNNLREGWLSLGNQIGEQFQDCKNRFFCGRCQHQISQKNPRFKSKQRKNINICGNCIQFEILQKGQNLSDFIRLENLLQQDVIHHYHKCCQCDQEPIWGVKFQCQQCENRDFCQKCFDEVIFGQSECKLHLFQIHQSPHPAHRLPVHHGKRCISCLQTPVLGPCFVCTDCSYMVLCQNCFFNCSFRQFDSIKGHDLKHKIQLVTLAQKTYKMSVCHACGRSPLISPKYRCESCTNFELCEHCFIRRESLSFDSHTHSSKHSFAVY